MHPARHFTQLTTHKVRCDLCPHHCLLTEGKRGICLTRQNVKGTLVSLNYCRPVSMNIDPIEKKPLYHFYPGTQIFSTGPNGCNLKCQFCQNCEISQELIPAREIPLKDFITKVITSDTAGIAYTYSEPFIWFETIMEVAPAIKEKGLINVMVTNGFIEQKPLAELMPYIDAMNIDIKAINPAFYRRMCKAQLEPVLKACEYAKKHCHIEITNLIIPGENDSAEDLRSLCKYIAENLGKDTPLHFSRYYPRYKISIPPTPASTLARAWEIAHEFLEYVYIGNMEIQEKSNTYCPSCKNLLIRRSGYFIEFMLDQTKIHSSDRIICPRCSFQSNIIMQKSP
jgi:pyruvate formate lyase activating enzyme